LSASNMRFKDTKFLMWGSRCSSDSIHDSFLSKSE